MYSTTSMRRRVPSILLGSHVRLRPQRRAVESTMRSTERTPLPDIRERLNRRDRHEQHPDVVTIGVVPVFTPRPSKPNPHPETNQQIEHLDVSAHQYVVPFEDNLIRGKGGKGGSTMHARENTLRPIAKGIVVRGTLGCAVKQESYVLIERLWFVAHEKIQVPAHVCSYPPPVPTIGFSRR